MIVQVNKNRPVFQESHRMESAKEEFVHSTLSSVVQPSRQMEESNLKDEILAEAKKEIAGEPIFAKVANAANRESEIKPVIFKKISMTNPGDLIK